MHAAYNKIDNLIPSIETAADEKNGPNPPNCHMFNSPLG